MNLVDQITALFPWLPTDPKVMLDGWGLAIAVPLVGWLISRFRKPNAASSQHYASEYLAKNRLPLLRRLHEDLDARFQAFLFDRRPLELTKTVAPDEVNHPRSLQDSIACILERNGTALETTNQPVAALFDRPDVGRRLAILGKPGSGKTVCLLKLLEHLLHEAEADAAAPLPLLFECSEWDGRELPSWMAWQLHRRYAFPEDTACQLVQAGHIFPLFDGLDELAAGKQEEFVRAFNAFADNRHLVLCCRLEEYRHLREHTRNLRKHTGQKLSLNTALILQDISPQQIEGHLRRQGLDELWSLIECSERDAISKPLRRQKSKKRRRTPQNLLQITQRPLFLGLMIKLADSINQGWRRRQGETWEDCIWRLYLDQCLDEKQASWNKSPDSYGAKYRKEQSMHWLHCLARWMRTEQKIELHIDELQPNMLKSYGQFDMFYGLSIGLPLILMIWWSYRPTFEASFGFITLYTMLYISLIVKKLNKHIVPLRQFRLPTSWQHVENIVSWLFGGLLTGLFTGLLGAMLGEIIVGLSFGLAVLSLGLIGGLSFGLVEGLRTITDPISETTKPQERIANALCSVLLFFPLFIFLGITVFFQLVLLAEYFKVSNSQFFDMQLFHAVLGVTIFCSFLILGTNQVLQHYLLRLCLRLEGQLPFRLVPWLEAVQQRKVLQRTGGSYRFLHKQLQEYLAKQAAQ